MYLHVWQKVHGADYKQVKNVAVVYGSPAPILVLKTSRDILMTPAGRLFPSRMLGG